MAKRGPEAGKFEIMIFLPVLIFQGKLYAWLDGDVNEVDEVLLEGRCHTRRYFENMLIGVVRGNHFKKFLSEVNEDSMELAKRICSERSELDEQVKAIVNSPYFDGHPSLRGRL